MRLKTRSFLVLLFGPSCLALLAAMPAPAQKVYFSENGAIRRANLDGSSIELIATISTGTVTDLEIDVAAGKLYWSNAGEGVKRRNLDGTGVIESYTLPFSTVVAIALDPDNDRLYFSTPSSTPRVRYVPLSTLSGAVTTVFTHLTLPGAWGLAVDTASATPKLYVADSVGQLKRSDLDGTNIEIVAGTAGDGARYVDLDRADGRAYWNASDTNNLRRVFFDGSSVETVVAASEADPGDRSLAIDPSTGKVYWPEGTSIYRRNADGTGTIETVIPSLAAPQAVAILPALPVLPALSVGGASLALIVLGLVGMLYLRPRVPMAG